MDTDDRDGPALQEPSGASLRALTGQAFEAFGTGQIAYVKPILVEGVAAWAIHAADGRPLTVVESRDLAFAVVRQNDMEPLGVH